MNTADTTVTAPARGGGDPGPLRWAVIGTGTISRSVVPDLQSCEDAVVDIVHSRDGEKAERFAKEHGITAFTDDYAAVLADSSIDAVYLATPFSTHHRMTREALTAGKHVLVEKPLAMNAREAEELFAIARAEGRFLMEAMWMKFSPAFIRLREEVAGGTIGEARNVRATFGIPFPQEDNASKWDVARSGGSLLDQGIYPITLAHTMFGEPTRIFASGRLQDDGLDISEHFTIEYAGGRYAQCASSMSEFGELTASVGGTGGWLTLAAPFWATTVLTIHAGSAEKIFLAPEQVVYPREGHGYVPMLKAVCAAISSGLTEHPTHTAADTIGVFTTIDAIFALIRGTNTTPRKQETHAGS